MNLFYLFSGLVGILTLIIAYTVGLEYFLRRKQERRNSERRSNERRIQSQDWNGEERRELDRRQDERRDDFKPGFA